MKFSIVIPFKDTPKEREFAYESIPAAIALKPDELMIGVDSPASTEFLNFIKGVAGDESPDILRIVEVPRSPGWGFQLAYIVWECCAKCRNDDILLSNIDVVLRPAVLLGLERLQQDEVALVCFPEKLLTNGPLAVIANVLVKRYLQTNDAPSGVYWIDRPQLLEDVDLDALKKIENGIDTYIMAVVKASKKHKSSYVRDLACHNLERTNPELPWRQFQKGIWLYASLDRLQEDRLARIRDKRTAWTRRLIDRLFYRFPWARVLLPSLALQRPWLMRGYLWAQKHEGHVAVTEARKMAFEYYVLTGVKYIRDIHQWGEHGRTGTGFR